METQISSLNQGNSLLRACDVAHRLNICLSLAYRLMQEGKIPIIRINRSVRVRESDLNEFINRNCTGWIE